MNFVRNVTDSIWSPGFYAGITTVTFGCALRYFCAFALLLVAIRLVPFVVGGVVLLPLVTTGLADLYPPDLELRVTKGVVTTNVAEPYFIPMPEYVALADGPRNIAVIDTRTPPSRGQLDEYQAAAWIHSAAVYLRDDLTGELVPLPIDEDADFILDRKAFVGYVADAQPWILALGGLGLIGGFVALYAGFMLRLVYLLAAVLLIFGIARMLRYGWSYADSYKAGPFAMTAAFLVDLAVDVAGLVTPITGFSNMFTLVTVATVTFNLAFARRRERIDAAAGVSTG